MADVSTVVGRGRSTGPQQEQTAIAADSGFPGETNSPSMLPGEARLQGRKEWRVERRGRSG